jgi:hypothetical protein
MRSGTSFVDDVERVSAARRKRVEAGRRDHFANAVFAYGHSPENQSHLNFGPGEAQAGISRPPGQYEKIPTYFWRGRPQD